MDLRQKLLENQDLKYKEFHKKLVPNIDENKIIGVRIPIIRKIAKEAFLSNAENKLEYYEEIMVYGLTLGMIKCSADEHMNQLEGFVKLIDNWAVCDTCCSSFKFTKKYKDEMYPFILSYIGKGEYETRFAVVMLMDYYLCDEYIDKVLEIIKNINSNYYYVNMACAWAVQAAFVKYRNKTLALLKSKCLNADVQNKAIQKIRDSYRVSDSDKELLKLFKI